MEEKPEGTPNPLNPSAESVALDANPSEPMEGVGSTSMEEALGVAPEAVPEPAAEPEPATTPEPAPAPKVAPAKPVVNTPPRPANPARPVDPMIPVRPKAGPVVEPVPQPMAEPTPAPTVEPASQPAPRPVTPQPVPQPTMHPAPQPMTQPAMAPQAMGVVTNMDGTLPTQEADPLNRPMQKAVEQLPPKPKKKKTGLIIGMVVSLFIAIGCGVAAALIFANSNKTDPVAAAVDKLISGNAPTNVSFDGTIDVDISDESSPFADMKIILKGDAVTRSMINSSQATLNARLKNGESFSVELSEVYAANGDLYLKIDGVTDAMSNPYILDATADSGEEATLYETDCEADEDCVTVTTSNTAAAESLAATLSILGTVEGEWIRVSTDSLSALSQGSTSTENSLTCLTNLMGGTSGNNNSLYGIYSKYPFITSSAENVWVASEKNPIYRVMIDSEKLTGFMDEAQNSATVSSLANCLGYDSGSASTGAISSSQKMPEVYVEVDSENNFTRFYLKMETTEDCVSGSQTIRACDPNEVLQTVTVDLNFTFPSNVNIPEPVEYTDIEAMMQEIVMQMYDLQSDTTEVEVIDVGDEITE